MCMRAASLILHPFGTLVVHVLRNQHYASARSNMHINRRGSVGAVLRCEGAGKLLCWTDWLTVCVVVYNQQTNLMEHPGTHLKILVAFLIINFSHWQNERNIITIVTTCLIQGSYIPSTMAPLSLFCCDLRISNLFKCRCVIIYSMQIQKFCLYTQLSVVSSSGILQ